LNLGPDPAQRGFNYRAVDHRNMVTRSAFSATNPQLNSHAPPDRMLTYNNSVLHDSSGNPAMFLLKLGQREYMEQFRKGLLYMNTLNYFRELDGDPARADRYEGVTHIFQPKDVIMRLSVPGFGEITIGSEDLAAATTLSMNSESRCNIFCLHAITAPVNGALFPSEHEWFGDSIVLVLNTQDFLTRVLAASKARSFMVKGNLVEYYDSDTYTGKLDRFRKSKRFAHQREYRIAVESPGTEPLTLDIGNITDITSEVVPLSDANNVFKFSEDDARAAALFW
jgi:hypothetical protein